MITAQLKLGTQYVSFKASWLATFRASGYSVPTRMRESFSRARFV